MIVLNYSFKTSYFVLIFFCRKSENWRAQLNFSCEAFSRCTNFRISRIIFSFSVFKISSASSSLLKTSATSFNNFSVFVRLLSNRLGFKKLFSIERCFPFFQLIISRQNFFIFVKKLYLKSLRNVIIQF